MQAIKLNSSSIVIYMGTGLLLDQAKASGPGWVDFDTTTANAQLVDGVTPPADWQGGHYGLTGTTWTRTDAGNAAQAAALAEAKLAAIPKIDADVDAIYGAVLGNRAAEYELAEADAKVYQTAGYSGTVPASVQAWATAKGWTAQQAADDVLATAAGWRTAQASIRAARLLRKEQVRNATDAAAVTAAVTAWETFAAGVRGQLGIA